MVAKRNKTSISFLLILLLLISVQTKSMAVTQDLSTNKIDSLLLEEMENAEGEFSVFIWATTPDLTQWEEGKAPEYVKEGSFLDGRSFLQKKLGVKKSLDFSDNVYGLWQWCKISGRVDASWMPLGWYKLTKDEILQTAAHEEVVRIDWVRTDQPFAAYGYDAQDALRILQVTVDLREGDYRVGKDDVDNDGIISSLDALYALQCSVGLLRIEYWKEYYEGPDKTSQSLRKQMARSEGLLPVYIVGQVSSEVPETWQGEWDIAHFEQYLGYFQASLGLEDSELVLHTNYLYHMSGYPSTFMEENKDSVTIAVWLTKEEILRVVSLDVVTCITSVVGDNFFFTPVTANSYNADWALWILQASVGARPVMGYYDVDCSGSADAADALLALQESVDLCVIGEQRYLYEAQTNIPHGYDWEGTRNAFLYAQDENQDGVMDELDLIIKYRELWT